MENLPVNERETTSFARALMPIFHGQEADRRPKSKHSPGNSSVNLMQFGPEPRSAEYHFLSLELSTLCFTLMNSIVP